MIQEPGTEIKRSGLGAMRYSLMRLSHVLASMASTGAASPSKRSTATTCPGLMSRSVPIGREGRYLEAVCGKIIAKQLYITGQACRVKEGDPYLTVDEIDSKYVWKEDDGFFLWVVDGGRCEVAPDTSDGVESTYEEVSIEVAMYMDAHPVDFPRDGHLRSGETCGV